MIKNLVIRIKQYFNIRCNNSTDFIVEYSCNGCLYNSKDCIYYLACGPDRELYIPDEL